MRDPDRQVGTRWVRTVTVTEDEAGIRLDRWFRRHFAGLGHGRLEKLLRTGQVRVDGGRSRASTRLQPGQVVRVPPLGELPAAPAAPRPPQPRPGDVEQLRGMVIHLDDDVVALNKPPGLAVQGGTGLTRHLDAMLDALRFGGAERPRLVHRLDKDTSGVLVLARNAFAAAQLAAAFRSRAAEKTYWALVVGVPRSPAGRITSDLAKRGGRGAERVAEAGEGGRRAATEYETVEVAGKAVAWLALRPHTGRTHQLRVHCASLGTPILGDGKYGGRAALVSGPPEARMLHLHACALDIPHPRGGTLHLEAPLPDRMAATWHFFGFDPAAAATPAVRRAP
jgi:23S rRNA pseudouridine955/2504/2580 synthase